MAKPNSNIKVLRTIVKKYFDYWFTYNDKTKTDRKIKFMRNGYQFSEKQYNNMLKNIKRDLKKQKVAYTTIDWKTCMSWRGPYVALIVRIKD